MHHEVYGNGYLATVISSCLADFGLPVTCFHEDVPKIASLARDETPYYEKNLKEVVRRNVRSGRLTFSHDVDRTARRSLMIFLAEDRADGIEELALRLAKYGSDQHMLIISTPVSVGTASRIEHKLRSTGSKVTVISHPVFVTDGCAVEDFNWPDRILLGTTSNSAVNEIKSVYRPLVMRGVPVIVTSFQTAEDRKSTRLNSIHMSISYAVFCLKKKKKNKKKPGHNNRKKKEKQQSMLKNNKTSKLLTHITQVTPCKRGTTVPAPQNTVQDY